MRGILDQKHVWQRVSITTVYHRLSERVGAKQLIGTWIKAEDLPLEAGGSDGGDLS